MRILVDLYHVKLGHVKRVQTIEEMFSDLPPPAIVAFLVDDTLTEMTIKSLDFNATYTKLGE